MRVLSAHKKPISSLAFSRDGALLAEAGHESTARVWDLTKGEVLHTFETKGAHKNQVRVGFSPDGATLAVANESVELIDLESGERTRLKAVVAKYDSFNGVCFSPDGKRVAAGGHPLWVWWDARTREPIPAPDWAKKKCNGWLCGWNAVAFSPDGARYATALASGMVEPDEPGNTIFVLELPRKKVVASLAWDGPCAMTVLLPPDNKTVIAACGTLLRAWDIASGEELAAVKSGKKLFMDAALSPDGRFVATVSKDHTTQLWDTRTWGEPKTFDWEIGELRAVAFAPDGQTVAVGSHKGKVLLFDVD